MLQSRVKASGNAECDGLCLVSVAQIVKRLNRNNLMSHVITYWRFLVVDFYIKFPYKLDYAKVLVTILEFEKFGSHQTVKP